MEKVKKNPYAEKKSPVRNEKRKNDLRKKRTGYD